MKELKIEVPQGYEVDTEKSTFEKIIFKKIENKLPKTWEEFCEKNSVKKEYYITNRSSIIEALNSRNRDYNEDKNLLSSKVDAEAHLALMQLHRLRDVYRQGWKPDYSNSQERKWNVYCIQNSIEIIDYSFNHRFLSFPKKEIARQFLENFKDLIEKAKDLI